MSNNSAEIDALKESPSGDGMERIFTLRFSFEQLAQDLRDLGSRIDELAKHTGQSLPD